MGMEGQCEHHCDHDNDCQGDRRCIEVPDSGGLSMCHGDSGCCSMDSSKVNGGDGYTTLDEGTGFPYAGKVCRLKVMGFTPKETKAMGGSISFENHPHEFQDPKDVFQEYLANLTQANQEQLAANGGH